MKNHRSPIEPTPPARRFLRRRATALLAGLALMAALTPDAFSQPVSVTPEKGAPALSVVRVNATTQPWDFFKPWSKKAPFTRRALGAVLAGNRVLVTAELVANANFVELEKAESGEKVAASVAAVDYEANLALIEPSSAKFLDGIRPLELTDAPVGSHLSIWQLEGTGALLATSALVTTVEGARYPLDDTSLLVCRVTASLQYREGSFTVPMARDGKLAGILMRYDPRTQGGEAIPTPVIAHFLKDAAGKSYGGFPRAGMECATLRDPQLRHYAGLNGNSSGVYVTAVRKDSPAAAAGLKPGDVLTALNGQKIDRDGNYPDPRYGKLFFNHLISTVGYVGDRVKLSILRAGKPLDLELTLAHRPVEDYVIEPYTIDRAPRYFVLGGLVFQELSRQYLKEWGDWQKKAPERFVYYDRYQTELFQDSRKKIIILSHVLPSGNTLGYEDLNYLVVTKINNVPLNSFADIAAAVEKPVGGFHKIEFEDAPKMIYLDAAKVAEGNPALMKNYGLPSLKRME